MQPSANYNEDDGGAVTLVTISIVGIVVVVHGRFHGTTTTTTTTDATAKSKSNNNKSNNNKHENDTNTICGANDSTKNQILAILPGQLKPFHLEQVDSLLYKLCMHPTFETSKSRNTAAVRTQYMFEFLDRLCAEVEYNNRNSNNSDSNSNDNDHDHDQKRLHQQHQ